MRVEITHTLPPQPTLGQLISAGKLKLGDVFVSAGTPYILLDESTYTVMQTDFISTGAQRMKESKSNFPYGIVNLVTGKPDRVYAEYKVSLVRDPLLRGVIDP